MNIPLDQIWAMQASELGTMFRLLPSARISGFGGAKQREPGSPRGLTVIPIVGLIEKSPSIFGWLFGGCSTVETCDKVRRAAADPACETIVLYIDSPGGQFKGTPDLADAIYEARQSKNVVAYVSDTCCSAAYYLASQATRIYANPSAVIGSIGVIAIVADTSRAFETQGIKVHAVHAGKFKADLRDGLEITDEMLARLQKSIDGMYRMFVTAVARGRGMPFDRVRSLADADVHFAAEAQRLGLIDGIQTFEQTVAAVSRPAEHWAAIDAQAAEARIAAAAREEEERKEQYYQSKLRRR